MKTVIDQNFNFLIIGGGSAGWISALFVRANFPEANVTVVQSSEIGILGAGEGTTPHIIDYLDEIDIPVSELIKNCKATIKNGIKFSNWNGDRDFYYHSFPDNFDLDHTLVSELRNTKYPLLDLEIIANNRSLNEIDFNTIASQKNCVRFVPNSDLSNKDLDPILHFTRLGRIALHFDAVLLAQYLETVGRSRNIDVLDTKVNDILLSENGYISAINTDIGNVPCDFVFDCSGFQRLIIGKKFKTQWNSYKKHLPAKRAMPFFIPNNTNIIPPYTDSTAMKYGWLWKIPVQGRYGCGYVFDSDRITDDHAKDELDKEIGFEVEIPRTINFEPGRYQNIYEKNCIAIGLSSGFIEPLEATSIWTSIMMLKSWIENIEAVTHNDQRRRDIVNSRFRNMSDNTLGFVYFHYITQRNDTDFWKNFIIDNEVPHSLQTLIDESKYTIPSYDMFSNIGLDWAAKSFLACGNGQKFFNCAHAKKLFDSCYTGQRKYDYDLIKFKYIKNINLNLTTLIDHYSFIEYLKEN
jgi:tryptophan halogenase